MKANNTKNIVQECIKAKKRIDMRPYCGAEDCGGDGCGNPGKMLTNCKGHAKKNTPCYCVVCTINFGCIPIQKAFLDVSKLKN